MLCDSPLPRRGKSTSQNLRIEDLYGSEAEVLNMHEHIHSNSQLKNIGWLFPPPRSKTILEMSNNDFCEKLICLRQSFYCTDLAFYRLQCVAKTKIFINSMHELLCHRARISNTAKFLEAILLSVLPCYQKRDGICLKIAGISLCHTITFPFSTEQLLTTHSHAFSILEGFVNKSHLLV